MNTTTKVINHLSSLGVQFTAFDVTRILRHHGAKVRHAAVRAEVVEEYFSGITGYIRTSSAINGSIPVIIYHPVSVDPSAYDPEALNPASGPLPTTAVPSTPTAPSTTTAPSMTTERGCDADGRVFVPPKYCRAIGLTPGNTAYFTYTPGKLEIGLSGTEKGISLQHNFRVNPTTLNKAGLSKLPKYKISVVGSHIVVEKP